MQKSLFSSYFLLLVISCAGLLIIVPLKHSLSFSKTDSLWRVWKDTARADTSRLKAIHSIAWKYIFHNPDSAYLLAEEELSLAKKNALPYWKSKAFHVMGTSFYVKGDYENALEYYHKRLVEVEKINDQGGLSSCYNNIGNIYRDQGKSLQAIEYYQYSLTLKSQLKDHAGMARSYGNIAIVYNDQKDPQKALEYNEKALELLKKLGDNQALSNTYNSLGIIYGELKNYDKALENHHKSLALREDQGNYRGIMHSYGNIGLIYDKKDNYQKAMDYYQKGLDLAIKMGNKQALASAFHNIGSIYESKGNYQKALEFCRKGYNISIEINALKQLRDNCKCLSMAYEGIGSKGTAFRFYKEYIGYRDSIRNSNRDRELAKKEFQYEYEIKATADSIKNAQIKKVQDAILMAQKSKLKEEETLRHSLYAGLGIVALFLLILFKRFQLEKKQKKIIEKKNKSITDSIRYAQRIQNAVLPDDEKVDELLPESFVFYRPKDVVSGDFYWIAEKDNKVFFAACDCTGHGVPGAFMSMIGASLLNEAVNEKRIYKPGLILDEVRRGIINSLQQSGDKRKQDDGMDASLCCLDKNTLSLEYAGAYNHLWRVKDGSIEIVKGNMQPIGYHRKQKPFTNHSIQLNKGECVYVFSDGYMDQFGGPDHKKFGFSAFSDLVLSIQENSMADQYRAMEKGLDTWKGSIEQVDDILVIGVRV